MEETIAKPYCY